ncbi:MAG: NAD(P)H-dependent oxidoreductase [Clostridia bacterium]|nr:NAD(P)H-dependent oxidoreductase [Clostridia bacterium]
MRIAVVVGNPKPQSRTLSIATAVSAAIAGKLRSQGAATAEQVLDLAPLAPSLFTPDDQGVRSAVETAVGADLLVIASPTYKAAYTGLLKAFLDLFPGNALAGKVAVPVMVGAAPVHALAVEVHLRPVLVELGAICPTRGLFVLDSVGEALADVVTTWLADNGPALVRALRGGES